MNDREDRIVMAILAALKTLDGYLVPEPVLHAEVNLRVVPNALLSEFGEALRIAESRRWIGAVRGGVLDSHYIGEIMIIAYNAAEYPIPLKAGNKVAHLKTREATPPITWELVESLQPTERGADGFGSTGIS